MLVLKDNTIGQRVALRSMCVGSGTKQATKHFNSFCGKRQGGDNAALKPLTLNNEDIMQNKVLLSPLNNICLDSGFYFAKQTSIGE